MKLVDELRAYLEDPAAYDATPDGADGETRVRASIAAALALMSAESASTGMVASEGSFRCSMRNSQPFITGSIRSRMISPGRSLGELLRSCISASRPSPQPMGR